MIRRKVLVPVVTTGGMTVELDLETWEERLVPEDAVPDGGGMMALQAQMGWQRARLPEGGDGGAYGNAEVFVRRAQDKNLAAPAERALDALKGSWFRPRRGLCSTERWLAPWAARLDLEVFKPSGAEADGPSATLGLALAALMAAANAPDRPAIATGNLDIHAIHDADVPVLPIGSLLRKLEIVEAWAATQPLGRPVPFFIPVQDLDDGAFTAWEQRLWPKIRLVRVRTLRQAAKVMDAERSHPRLEDALLCAGLASLLAFGGMQGWLAHLRAEHLAWARSPIALSLAEPVSRWRGGSSTERAAFCDKVRGGKGVAVGDVVYATFRLGDPARDQTGPYYPALFLLREHASPQRDPWQLYTPALNDRTGCKQVPVAAGQPWCVAVEFEDKPAVLTDAFPDEMNILVAVAEREGVQQAPQVFEALKAAFPAGVTAAASHQPTRMAEFVKQAFRGRVADEVIVSVMRPQDCRP